MKVAVQGCCHGQLTEIYEAIRQREEEENVTVDLLLICGDFQAMRDKEDLSFLACPPKFRHMGSFWEYYSGQKVAPIPTIFIGGNHEASNHLWELFHGGFVAPNIYFLGFCGVIKFGELRIGGVSGIYKEHHYNCGYFERMPYDESTMRSIYHSRMVNTFKLSQIAEHLDIFLSHDWPRNISKYGDERDLLRRKSFLRTEIANGTFGSPANEYLLHHLKPRHWFSAHMHTKFEATVVHGPVRNPDEIVISSDDDDEEEQENTKPPKKRARTDVEEKTLTHFLALSKCLPNHEFLEILDIPVSKDDGKIRYDTEWLAIVKASNDFISLGKTQQKMPDSEEFQKLKLEAYKHVLEMFLDYPNKVFPPEFQESVADGSVDGFNRRRIQSKPTNGLSL